MIEGGGHAFIADAFRVMTGAQLGAIQGFVYTKTDGDGGDYITYASYFFSDNPSMVNRIAIDKAKHDSVKVLVRDSAGALKLVSPSEVASENVVGVVDVIVAYIQSLPNQTFTANNTPFPRLNITQALPDTTSVLGFPVIEPVFGMNPLRY